MGKSGFGRVLLGTAVGLLAVTAGVSAAAGQASAPGVSLAAKVIGGEVYVKASALTGKLGGTGTYNAKAGTFDYVPPADVPSVIAKVSPSVVAIIGKPAGGGTDAGRFALSHGTGIVLKADGLIVTNAHVVKDMTNIVVVTADGKEYAGKRTHMDELSDIALVKINAAGLKPAALAPSPLQLKVGESVVAIGTPVSFTLRNTATTGILSGMNRSLSSAYKLLQTDAAINPGNSGGPLVNLKGQVIGINTLKFVEEGVDNLGFSIPADTVQYVVSHLQKYGKVKRPSLGLELEESWAAIVGLPTTDPLTIQSVTGESARAAGLKAGDVLYSVAGKQVATAVEINELLKDYLPGQKVEVMVQSDGDLVTRTVTLSEAA